MADKLCVELAGGGDIVDPTPQQEALGAIVSAGYVDPRDAESLLLKAVRAFNSIERH